MFKAIQNYRPVSKLLEQAKSLDAKIMQPMFPEDISGFGQNCTDLVKALSDAATLAKGSRWLGNNVFDMAKDVIRNPYLPYSDEQTVLATMDTLTLSPKNATYLTGYRAYQAEAAQDAHGAAKLKADGVGVDHANWGIRIINRLGYCNFAEARHNLSQTGAERPGPSGTVICGVVLESMHDAREMADFIGHCPASFLVRVAHDKKIDNVGKISKMLAESPAHAGLSHAWNNLTAPVTEPQTLEEKLQAFTPFRRASADALRAA